MQNLRGITSKDKRKRVIFAHHCQNQPEGMSEYLSKIGFSDECIFRLNGSISTQNVRIWVQNVVALSLLSLTRQCGPKPECGYEEGSSECVMSRQKVSRS